MPRRSNRDIARDKQLAAIREKKQSGNKPKSADSILSKLTVSPDSDLAPVLQVLSISEHEQNCQNHSGQSPTPSNNNIPDASAPPEPEILGANPEELPLEDPIDGTNNSGDFFDDNDGWWEQGIDDVEVDLPENGDYVVRVDNQPIPTKEQERLIKELDDIVKMTYKGHGKTRHSTLGKELDCGLVRGLVLAAVAIGRTKSAASSARKWIREFWRTGKLPENLYGTWNESIIEDKDFKTELQDHLRCIGRYAGPKDIISFFSTPEAEPFTHLLDNLPCIRTAQRWMPILGYKWKTEHRGQFADGHEREDVVDYRTNKYIPEFMKYLCQMRLWDDDGKEIPPDLAEGERECVVHWHDETIYHANDRRWTRWVHEGETAGLYKKGEGQSLMVADMISAKYGFLRHPSGGQENPVQVLFHPGKERNGYFCNDDVCRQLEEALRVVSEAYPNEDHLFIFDNATTHTKLPDDAPVVGKMTLGPSFKVGGESMTSTGEKIKINFTPGKFSDESPQEFYYPVDHPKKELQGAFKGLAKILEERGIVGTRKLKLQCPTTKGQTGCPPNQTSCCARTIMANQPDILAQKTKLQLLAESYGCSVLYLPKYHCELNPIEQCWGMAKWVYRDYPMSSTEADLTWNAVASLESVPLESIRR
ncbi:hypothetical protein CTheo_208 [Ceratobasidium theobromae]|uniref:DDE family endonuclease n=1 Tax=Ceratobasidium theobromae TaxID=1582974 RepID=A0A5N5QXC0_9AGAM|nr:hypothetical protein CTheo_208 [Ceratobasidium theobromae]